MGFLNLMSIDEQKCVVGMIELMYETAIMPWAIRLPNLVFDAIY